MKLKIYLLIENRDHRRFKVESNFLTKELNNIVSSKKETINSFYLNF
jgi:hypothetical protein